MTKLINAVYAAATYIAWLMCLVSACLFVDDKISPRYLVAWGIIAFVSMSVYLLFVQED